MTPPSAAPVLVFDTGATKVASGVAVGGVIPGCTEIASGAADRADAVLECSVVTAPV